MNFMDRSEISNRPSKKIKLTIENSPTGALSVGLLGKFKKAFVGRSFEDTHSASDQGPFDTLKQDISGVRYCLDGSCKTEQTAKNERMAAPRKPDEPLRTHEQGASSSEGVVSRQEEARTGSKQMLQSSPYKSRTKLRPETIARLAQGQTQEINTRQVNFRQGHSKSRPFAVEKVDHISHPLSRSTPSRNRGFLEKRRTSVSGISSATIHQIEKVRASKKTIIAKGRLNNANQELDEISQDNPAIQNRDIAWSTDDSSGTILDDRKFASNPPFKQYKGYVYVPVENEQDLQSGSPDLRDQDLQEPANLPERRTRSLRLRVPTNQPHKKNRERKKYSSNSSTELNGAHFSDLQLETEKVQVNPQAEKEKVNVFQQAGPNRRQLNGLTSGRASTLHAQAQALGPSLKASLASSTRVSGETVVNDETVSLQAIKNLRSTLAECPDIYINQFKHSIISALTRRDHISLIGLSNQVSKVLSILRQTILAGEGNSLMIIGPRGSGKTALVERAISIVASEQQEAFHVIRLSGFVCTDDKIALKEIWRQLQLKIGEVSHEEAEDPRGFNYADALTRLLALLNHPSASCRTNEKGESDKAKSSARAVIFVLDEFHLFATHSRQTLLYNLLDCAQSAPTPIAVLGLSSHLHVAEMLEKRVKSRFSQRQVLTTPFDSMRAFLEFCSAALTPKPDEGCFVARSSNASDDDGGDKALNALSTAWKMYLKTCLFDPQIDPEFTDHLHRLFSRPFTGPAFLASAVIPMSGLSSHYVPTGKAFMTSQCLLHHPISARTSFETANTITDSKISLLSCLSTLQLSMLICAARIEATFDDDNNDISTHNLTCTFETVFTEYLDLASQAKAINSVSPFTSGTTGSTSERTFSKEMAKGAWEELCDVGLLVTSSRAFHPAPGISAGSGNTWQCEIALEEIRTAIGTGAGWGGIGAVLVQWCRGLA